MAAEKEKKYGDSAKEPPSVEGGALDTAPAVDYDSLFMTPATEQLKATRDYARSAKAPLEEVLAGCVQAIRTYGFCVVSAQHDGLGAAGLQTESSLRLTVRVAGQLDDVIPEEDIAAVREEVREAPAKNQANKQDPAGLRRKGRLKYPSEPVSDLVWMPKYAQHLAHPAVVAVAKAMLDDHLRIAQFNFRAIGVTPEEQLHSPNRPFMREWHTDWPHDLIGCKCSRSLCVFFRKPQRSGCTRRSRRAELRSGRRGAPLGAAQFGRRSPTVPGRLHVSHDDLVHDGRERAHGGDVDRAG